MIKVTKKIDDKERKRIKWMYENRIHPNSINNAYELMDNRYYARKEYKKRLELLSRI